MALFSHLNVTQALNRKLLRRTLNFGRRFFKRLPYLFFIKKKINWHQFKNIQKKYLAKRYNGIGPLKYFDHRKYLKVNIERAIELKLHKRCPLRVFDIGCGFGYFLFVSKQLGHEVLGLDFVEGDNSETRCYSDMMDMFGLNRILHQVIKYKELPFTKQKFDLITAFEVCFNLFNSSERWEKEEWHFFLRDLKKHLKPGGLIYFQFNERDLDNSFYSDSLKDYFENMGADFLRDGQAVLFIDTDLPD